MSEGTLRQTLRGLGYSAEYLRKAAEAVRTDREWEVYDPTEPGPECRLCRDGGFVRNPDRSLRVCPNCEAGIRHRMNGLPAGPRGQVSLDDLDEQFNQLRSACVGWMAEDPRQHPFLVLCGPRGNGKSHAGIAIGRAWARQNHTVLYRQAPALLDELRATFDSEEQTLDSAMWAPLHNDLLILDDFGAEKATDWATEKLFRIIDTRYTNSLLTVITTNLRPAQIRTDRSWSRVLDQHTSLVVLALGPDRRDGSDAEPGPDAPVRLRREA